MGSRYGRDHPSESVAKVDASSAKVSYRWPHLRVRYAYSDDMVTTCDSRDRFVFPFFCIAISCVIPTENFGKYRNTAGRYWDVGDQKVSSPSSFKKLNRTNNDAETFLSSFSQRFFFRKGFHFRDHASKKKYSHTPSI